MKKFDDEPYMIVVVSLLLTVAIVVGAKSLQYFVRYFDNDLANGTLMAAVCAALLYTAHRITK